MPGVALKGRGEIFELTTERNYTCFPCSLTIGHSLGLPSTNIVR